MLRANSLKRLTQKRTIRPLYAWHQATPYAAFLDAAVSTSTLIYPGMVASKSTGEQMVVCNNTLVPFGLFANFINGAMDELGGGTEIGVWRGGPDATFEILAGPSSTETPLAPGVDWVSKNATAGGVALFSNANGRLAATGDTGDGAVGTLRVARLVEAVSNAKIIVTLDLAVV
jgi:hypothetical protein